MVTVTDRATPARLDFSRAAAFASLPWEPPAGALYDGRWRDPDGPGLAVRHPETDHELGTVACCDPAQVADAVDALRSELATPWPLHERREALVRAAEILTSHAERTARLICTEGSKTITEGRREVARAVETLTATARSAHVLEGRTLPFDDSPRGAGRIGWYRRSPVGLVAAVTSYNDPLNLAVHKVAPALLAGNVVALKPAELTPFSSLHLAQVLLEAGVPPGRIAVLPGPGPTTGAALVAHPGVDLVSFTGGAVGGNAVARAAGARRTHMELGGNGAVVVCADADLTAAAGAIVEGGYGFAGQNCISVQRVVAHASVAEELTSRICARVAALRLGPRDQESTEMGCLITAEAATRVRSLIDDAAAAGARVLTGGASAGAWVEPTVIDRPDLRSEVWSGEVFGPVVSVRAVASDDEAVRSANDTPNRLQAGVFTADVTKAMTLGAELRFGAVWINDSCDFRLDAAPFGGFGSSSIGREGAPATVEAMTEPKIVAINTGAASSLSS